MEIDNYNIDKNIEIVEQKFSTWEKTHEWLSKYLKSKGTSIKVGVEIGVAYGGNLNTILEKTSITKLYGVDPYEKSRCDLHENIEEIFGSFDHLYEAVDKCLVDKYGDRVELIRKTSEEASKYFKDNSLDFVFIDGDHMDVANDIKYWEPKVKIGGYVMGHDWGHPSYGCIQEFLTSYYDPKQLKVNIPADIWYVQKK